MYTPREQIYAALFAKVAAAANFTTISRRLKHWADVPAGDQPALFMAQRKEIAQTVPGLQTVFVMHVDLYLYANTGGDSTTSPSTILNPLLDSVLASIAFDVVTNKQTLGGLVQYCVVDGEIATDEGVLGNQGVAIIPIQMKSL